MLKAFHTQDYHRFIELLVRRRKDAQLTQTDVAKRLKRPQSYVAKYERGERRLDVIEFLEIARVLDFDAATFIRALMRAQTSSQRKP